MAIETKDLIKRYDRKILALNKINLSIQAGTIYALLGPNGAGKTTAISILTTLIEPTEGEAKVAGFDVVKQANEVRQHIGVTFQEIVLDDDLTGRQALDYNGRLYGIKKIERKNRISRLLEMVEMSESADRRVQTYSGGMKRRIEIARGLMIEPDVLFLDEPTLGLDPQNREKIWNFIQDLKKQKGLTILLTTHYMDEAQRLADKVGIIDLGKIVIEGTPVELINQMGSDVINIESLDKNKSFIEKIKTLPYVQNLSITNEYIQIGVDSGNKRLVEIVSIATDSNLFISDISVSKPNLGDIFLKYSGRQLRDK